MAGGKCASASIAVTNLKDTPVHVGDGGLAGTDLGEAAQAAAVAAMQSAIDPSSDNKGPAEFKRHVAGVILRRAIALAAGRAG